MAFTGRHMNCTHRTVEMRAAAKNRGFTLIELMIVVAIIGVLAAVAIASYSAYIEKSRNSEATAILADIRLKQEAYRGTFHQYANLAQNGCTWTPDNNPGSDQKLNWQASWNANCAANWRQLGVVPPDNGLYFSYAGVAGSPADDAPSMYTTAGLDDDNDFWYAARAVQDLDEDGAYGGFITMSGVMKIMEQAEGAAPAPL